MPARAKNKKAQTGMEYLMTYGWAMLVVGVIILLLMSLRVLDVDWWSVQNQVFGLSTFGMPDFKATPYPTDPAKSIFIFQLINNKGSNVTVYDMTFEGADSIDYLLGDGELPHIYVWQCPAGNTTCSLNATAFPFNMTAGQRFIVNGTIRVPGDINTVFSSVVIITYSSPRSVVNHTDTGKVRGRIEAAS